MDTTGIDDNSTNTSWRRALGWIGAVCVGLYYIPMFCIADVFWIMECIDNEQIMPFPVSPNDLMNLVYLLLGFGAFRSFDKFLLNKVKDRL